MITANAARIVAGLFASIFLCSICKAQGGSSSTLESRSTGRGYALCGSCTVPQNLSPTINLVSGNEPGERVILSGTVYRADGVTPDSGIILFVYQTDAGGYYHRPREDVFHPRLFGWLMTAGNGKYEIHTIVPAPEVLALREPAHIHVHVFGNGMEEHFLHEFWFQGDTRIPKEDILKYAPLRTFSPIVKLQKDKDGVLRGVRDIRIRRAAPWRYEQD